MRSKQQGQPATVYLRFTEGRIIDIWTPTPTKIFPEHWNNKTQSFEQRILYTDGFSEKDKVIIEEKFSILKSFITAELLKLNGISVTKEWLKSVIDRFYFRQTHGSDDLDQYIKRYIDEATSGKRLNSSGKIYSPHTIQSLKSLKNELKKFQEQKEKTLNFNDITIDFYYEFLNYFNKKLYSPNTIGKHLKSLKTVIRQAREESLHNNLEIERKAFKIISSEVDSVYLTEEEVRKLYNLDLSDKKHLEIARDVFLIGCYIAQRYSDYSRISKDNIKTRSKKKFIEIYQHKTGEKVIIPVRQELDEILKRYKYALPKTYEQKVNKYIKDVCKLAEITDPVNYKEFKGGIKLEQTVPKYKLIKTNTARRTGCTLMFLAGIPAMNLMKISGHKTESEFMKYIKVTEGQAAINLASHPYFT